MTEPDARPRISVCGIGASAGGVEALQQFFLAVAPDLGLAYVVIVHLAPDHKSELPAILSRCTTMPVVQVGDSHEPLQPDHVYVIAPDRKLEITDSAVGASPFDHPRGHRTAIDLFFRSLASTHGDGFAVLLSGSGSDGALGARAVKECGGLILVQDPDEAMHGGMPRAAISTGVADMVLPVRELAVRLGELARTRPTLQVGERDAETAEVGAAADDRALKGVLSVLRKRTGHDFSKYKRSTVLRRLARRMQLAHQLTIPQYLTFLRASATEPQELLNDLLISVTTFFRDPDAWAALQAQVIGPLVDHADSDTQLRVWVAGCATGEEAYALAILFCEEFDRHKQQANFVVFASDVDETALALARGGAVSARHQRGRVGVETRAVLPPGGRPLPGDDGGARPHRLRGAQPPARSAVLPGAPDRLPQRPDLSRSGAAGAGHERVPLRLSRRRHAVPRPVGVGERRPVSAASTRSIASSASGDGRTGAVPRCRTS